MAIWDARRVAVQISDVGQLLRCSDRKYSKLLGTSTGHIISRSPMAKMRMTSCHVLFVYYYLS